MDSLDSQAAVQPQVGEVIAGKYRLDRVLGAGGMGMVFAATHMELDRLVAVKFVHATYCQHPEVIARFLREAKAVVRIESEHVAKVIDVGRSGGGTPYMVMEYLDGEDLSEVLQGGPLRIPDAVDYIVQACAAMLEAHEMGIVHRDLKPANLFLTHRRDGSPLVKVLDFGISKLNDNDSSQAALTNPSMLMGSPAYMSPEQLTNPREVDPRTDLWSLGVILFELLAGRPAFHAQSLPLLMTAIMQQEPDQLRQLRPDVPEGLAAVVHRCLEKSVDVRFQTVPDLVGALLPFAPRRSHWSIERIAKSMNPGTLPSGVGRSSLGSAGSAQGELRATRRDVTNGIWTGESSAPPRKKRPVWVLPVVGFGVVAAAAIGAWLVLGGTSGEVPPTATIDALPSLAGGDPARGNIAEGSTVPGFGASPNPPSAAASAPLAVSVAVTAEPELDSKQPSRPQSGPNKPRTGLEAKQPNARVGSGPKRPVAGVASTVAAAASNAPAVTATTAPPPRPIPQPPSQNPLQMDLK